MLAEFRILDFILCSSLLLECRESPIPPQHAALTSIEPKCNSVNGTMPGGVKGRGGYLSQGSNLGYSLSGRACYLYTTEDQVAPDRVAPGAPLPHYYDIWDIDCLLSHLQTMHPPEILTDYQLSENLFC